MKEAADLAWHGQFTKEATHALLVDRVLGSRTDCGRVGFHGHCDRRRRHRESAVCNLFDPVSGFPRGSSWIRPQVTELGLVGTDKGPLLRTLISFRH